MRETVPLNLIKICNGTLRSCFAELFVSFSHLITLGGVGIYRGRSTTMTFGGGAFMYSGGGCTTLIFSLTAGGLFLLTTRCGGVSCCLG